MGLHRVGHNGASTHACTQNIHKEFVSNCVKMLGQEYQKQRRLAFYKYLRSDLRHRRRRWRSQHDGIKGAVSRLAVWKVAKRSDTMKIEKQLLNLVIMPLLT